MLGVAAAAEQLLIEAVLGTRCERLYVCVLASRERSISITGKAGSTQ